MSRIMYLFLNLLAGFKIMFYHCFWAFDHDAPWCTFVFVLGAYWVSWLCEFMIFIKFGYFSLLQFFLFVCFPCSFFETSITHILGHLKSHSSLMLCLFFVILFSCYIFEGFYYFIFTNLFFCNAQSAINPI